MPVTRIAGTNHLGVLDFAIFKVPICRVEDFGEFRVDVIGDVLVLIYLVGVLVTWFAIGQDNTFAQDFGAVDTVGKWLCLQFMRGIFSVAWPLWWLTKLCMIRI